MAPKSFGWQFVSLVTLVIGSLLVDSAHGSDSIELRFEENIFTDLQGVNRTQQGVTLGIPFTTLDDVRLVNGRPNLGLSGSGFSEWQYSAFELADPNDVSSPVVWATLDLVLDSVESGRPLRGVFVTKNGAGSSNGSGIARDLGGTIELNTGAARFVIRKQGFTGIDEAWSGGTRILKDDGATGVLAKGADGLLYGSRWGVSEATIVRNGPAFAKVRVVGDLRPNGSSDRLCHYVCELTTYANSHDIRARLSLIAGHEDQRSDLLFQWAHFVTAPIPSSNGASFEARTTNDANGPVVRSLSGADTLAHAQYQTDRPIPLEHSSFYYPGLPKNDFMGSNRSSVRILTGHRVIERTNGQENIIVAQTDPARSPIYQVMQLTRPDTGANVTALTRWSTDEFPTAIESYGAGFLVMELWPDELPSTYEGEPLLYAIPRHYSEAKEFVLSVRANDRPVLNEFGCAQTFDVEGRFDRFEDYGYALYREEGLQAMSANAQDATYRWMGLLGPNESIRDRIDTIIWDPTSVTRGYLNYSFLERNRTGGKWNHNAEEKNILAFLRIGRQGSLLQAKSYVDYIRTMQFSHNWQEGCGWDQDDEPHNYPYVTARNEADVEHDWWRAVRLMSRLKGDEWMREELLDHARTFRGSNDNLIYYRALVKTLEGLGIGLSMARFAYPPLPVDPCTGQTPAEDLRQKLVARLDDWYNRQWDVNDPFGGEGWVQPPGSRLPSDLGNPWQGGGGWPHWASTAHIDRGVRHDFCYECLDTSCGNLLDNPFGRRLFHEQLACAALSIAGASLPNGDPLKGETFLRLGQLGYTFMGICHWSHQTGPCGLPYPAPWQKQGDAAHIFLPPPCDKPNYDADGPLQEREGDGHLSYAFVGQGATAVFLQYLIQRNFSALETCVTKTHEILAAQRFQDSYNSPCPGSERWENTYFDINIDDPAHWNYLLLLVRFVPNMIRADFPAYNPESKFY